MDFSNICRTCLSKDRVNLKPIFSDLIENLIETIFSIAGVKIEPNDGLPQCICMDCLEILKNTIDFRKKCKYSETYLITVKKENINDANLVITEETIQPKLNENNNINTEIEIKNEIVSSDGDPIIVLKTKSITNPSNEKVMENLYNDKIKVTNIVRSRTCNDNKNRVTCQLCQKNLSIRSLVTHMVRTHPGADDRRIKCELCEEYVMKENLNRHLIGVHGSDTFKCRYCKKEFNTKELLVDHVTICKVKRRKRAGESGRTLIDCDVCQKKMQKNSLATHKLVKHAGMGPVCEHCGKRFSSKFRLNEHYRAKHGYEKFKCNTCDFQSANVMAMRNHERRHRGEKPYVCETCGAKFHAAYLLAQHKQSHRTSKQYKCEQCPASFKANNSLHTHRLTCHSTQRVSCAVCSRAYRCRYYVVRHMRTVHGFTGPLPELQTLY